METLKVIFLTTIVGILFIFVGIGILDSNMPIVLKLIFIGILLYYLLKIIKHIEKKYRE
jgi:hypothetical protein